MIQTEKTADLKMMSFIHPVNKFCILDWIISQKLHWKLRIKKFFADVLLSRDNLSSSSHGNDKFLIYKINFINVLPERNRIWCTYINDCISCEFSSSHSNMYSWHKLFHNVGNFHTNKKFYWKSHWFLFELLSAAVILKVIQFHYKHWRIECCLMKRLSFWTIL